MAPPPQGCLDIEAEERFFVNALVTGAGGFWACTSSNNCPPGATASARCAAEAIRNSTPSASKPSAPICATGQAVIAACRGIDVVFHVGGIAGMGGLWKHYYEINVLGTRHVVEGCLAHGVGRLVYTSSPSVTFDGRNQEGIDESAPYPRRWLCHYAHSKALAEQHVLAANGRGAC